MSAKKEGEEKIAMQQWEINFYSFHDHTHMVKYLEKRAQEGWLLDSMDRLGWTFCRIEPQDVHFLVSYTQKNLEAEPPFAGPADWKLAASNKYMHIFYSTQAKPTPVKIDAIQEVEEVHSRFLTEMLAQIGFFAVFFILFAGPFDLLWRLYAFELLRDPWIWILIGMITVLLAFFAEEVYHHYKWYNEALLAAEKGVILATKSTAFRNKCFWAYVAVVAIVGFIAWAKSL